MNNQYDAYLCRGVNPAHKDKIKAMIIEIIHCEHDFTYEKMGRMLRDVKKSDPELWQSFISEIKGCALFDSPPYRRLRQMLIRW